MISSSLGWIMKHLLAASLVSAAVGVVGCTSGERSPLATVAPSSAGAAADGSTLKAKAPVLVFPTNLIRLPFFEPTVTFTWTNVTMTYRPETIQTYELQNRERGLVHDAMFCGGWRFDDLYGGSRHSG